MIALERVHHQKYSLSSGGLIPSLAFPVFTRKKVIQQ